MTLSDVQFVSLKILKDIHSFCIKNNIKYTLQGGSLLGAVRHKGFIPWDDDIDIAMPRPDYERFIHTYQSEHGYKVYSRELPNQEIYLAFCRVCDVKDTYVNCEALPWNKDETGVWVDVFPLDGIEESFRKFMRRYRRMKFLWELGLYLRRSKRPYRNLPTVKSKVKWLACNILSFFSLSVFDKHIQLCRSVSFDQSEHYINAAYMDYGLKEIHKTKNLNIVVPLHFCDSEFLAMADYTVALREKYGDYMQLPPIEKRIPGHSVKHFWR